METLRGGPMLTKEIKEAAVAHGHTWRTVERAKKTLGLVATKAGFQGAWGWQLPQPKTATFDDEDRQLS
jgi:putative DNA primase/helicase